MNSPWHIFVSALAAPIWMGLVWPFDCARLCAQPFPGPPPPGGARPPIYSPLPQTPQVRAAGGNRSAPAQEFNAGRWLASVGNLHILAGDIEPDVNIALAPYVGKVPEFELQQQRKILVRQFLQNAIESKLVYLDFLRKIPAENIPHIKKRINESFSTKLEELLDQFAKADEKEAEKIIKSDRVLGRLVLLYQREGAQSVADLDAILRRYGSSMTKQRRKYVEQALVQSMIFQSIDADAEITHQQMLDYYHKNIKDYSFAARARWEQITVRFDKFATKREAYEAIAQMGNAIVLGGAPFGAVARRGSHGFTASQGGLHDWTSQDSLKSKKLDHALFSYPLNELSDIIEDDQGFHIIRVLERHNAGRTPFAEVQEKIESKLRREHRNKQVSAYLKQVKKSAVVVTAFDD